MHPPPFPGDVHVLVLSRWRPDGNEPGGDKVAVPLQLVTHFPGQRLERSNCGDFHARQQFPWKHNIQSAINKGEAHVGYQLLMICQSGQRPYGPPRWYLGLQKNLYWMRMVTANMTAPWIAMAQRFFPTMSQLRGSWNRSSPDTKRKYTCETHQNCEVWNLEGGWRGGRGGKNGIRAKQNYALCQKFLECVTAPERSRHVLHFKVPLSPQQSKWLVPLSCEEAAAASFG